MPGTIKIVAYSPDWVDRFDQERCALQKACGSTLTSIEHIGSTSVPGLSAKPIVDILAGVSERALLSVLGESAPAGIAVTPGGNAAHIDLVLRICRLGYVYRGENGIPGRLLFGKPEDHPREVHLHMVMKDGRFWHEYLLFRDFLRAHPDVSKAYAQLKKRLAAKHTNDRGAYTDAKTAFIRQCINAAHAWRATN